MGPETPTRLVTFVVGLPTPWLILWLGLAVLSAALLILMRTRWGQSQPLRKCVVLSLLAHALFGCFATTVKIVNDTAGIVESKPVLVTLPDVIVQSGKKAAETGATWDVPPSPLAEIETTAPARIDAAETSAPERVLQELTPQVPSTLVAQAPPSDKAVTPDLAEALEAVLPERTASSVAAEAIDVPAPAKQPEPAELALPLPEPQRAGVVAEASTTPARHTGESLPAPPINPLELAPQISDLERIETTADALLAQEDFLKRATGRTLTETPASLPEEESESASPQLDAGTPSMAGAGLVAVEKKDTIDAESAAGERANDFGPSLASLARQRKARHDLPPVYEQRFAADRLTIAQQRGGSPATEAAVEAALRWLAANQEADGRWSAGRHGAGREQQVLGHDRQGAGVKADTAMTGLTVLAFLGAGYTHEDGPYANTVNRGLEYLMSVQGRDGNLAGRSTLFARMYCHGMATLAMCEAYAMTRDPRLEPAVRQAIGYTISAQDPNTGGWRYQPGDSGDMSQHGWQVMALKSAELAGIPMAPTTRTRAVRFIDLVTTGTHRGLARYRQGQAPTRPMTAEALFCRQLLGAEQGPAATREGADFLLEELPGEGQDNFYYWYYATLTLYQSQGPAWETWNDALKVRLLSTQRRSDDLAGSWDPTTVWGGYGGRVYSTAMATLSLEVYYRYLPLYSLAAREELPLVPVRR